MTFITSILIFATIIFGASGAEAQVLRPRAIVDADVIRLGDLFASLPADVADRAVAAAPTPGRTTVFDAAALTSIARENLLTWTPQSRFDRTVVQRTSRVITTEEIESRILAALKAEGLEDGMRIDLLNRRLTLNAATGAGETFEIQNLQHNRRDNSFVVTLAVNAGAEGTAPIEVRGNVIRTTRVPVLTRAMRHGQIIADDDITWKDVREGGVDPAAVLDPESLIGKTPRTNARAGEVLRRAEVMAPIVITKGEVVTMILTTPQMTLTAQGRATENGAGGQSIKIENTRSRTTIEGVVTGPNRVVVHLPSLAALAR